MESVQTPVNLENLDLDGQLDTKKKEAEINMESNSNLG